MNLVLKTKYREVNTHIQDTRYSQDLTTSKIEMQEKYIADAKSNRESLLTEKNNLIANNEEEIFTTRKQELAVKEQNESILDKMVGENKATQKRDKLKDIQFTLKDKHNRNETMITFFEENDDCPVCEQHIEETFRNTMLTSKKKEYDKFDKGIEELSKELEKQQELFNSVQQYITVIRNNDAEIGKIKYSLEQLQKFNSNLSNEIEKLSSGELSKDDIVKLEKLKKSLKYLTNQKMSLIEEQTYADAARTMLHDTGIKTKIIKQYLPIMNKLINTYLTAMEFYVNFTLNENFEETIKSRHRDEFTYASFSEGEKMRIDLALLFTWRAIAKMKNSVNTNLLILDEIFDSSLDGQGTDEFLRILNTLGDENTFVISHKGDQLVDKFRNSIKFEKQQNFSRIA